MTKNLYQLCFYGNVNENASIFQAFKLERIEWQFGFWVRQAEQVYSAIISRWKGSTFCCQLAMKWRSSNGRRLAIVKCCLYLFLCASAVQKQRKRARRAHTKTFYLSKSLLSMESCVLCVFVFRFGVKWHMYRYAYMSDDGTSWSTHTHTLTYKIQSSIPWSESSLSRAKVSLLFHIMYAPIGSATLNYFVPMTLYHSIPFNSILFDSIRVESTRLDICFGFMYTKFHISFSFCFILFSFRLAKISCRSEDNV